MKATRKNSAIVAGLVLAVMLGTALTGLVVTKYHPECIDGIDNDGDGDNNGDDANCAEYPYADGEGESQTPGPQMTYDGVSTAFKSLSQYYIDYTTSTNDIEGNLCAGLALSLFNEPDELIAIDYVTVNNVNCGGAGP